jgi:hypothetical protein
LVGSAKRRIVNPDVLEELGRPVGFLYRLENHRLALPADPDALAVKTKIVGQLNCLRALKFDDFSSLHGKPPLASETFPSQSL